MTSPQFPNAQTSKKNFFKTFGPGLLFASAAIGTSHLVFSTKVGAEYGLIYALIIIGALFFNYPFFEAGGRYANGTGRNLLQAYKSQSKGYLILIIGLLCVNSFGIAALLAVTDGLLTTVLGLESSVAFYILIGTGLMLVIGRFTLLDVGIKLLAVVLFITVMATMVAVIFKGPVAEVPDFMPKSLWTPSGIALMIALMGYMPIPMYASIFQSVWSVAKIKNSGYHPKLSEQMLDFRIGYFFTVVMAFAFLIIGTFTLYGSGQELSDNNLKFAQQVITIFSAHIGMWSYTLVGIAAFAAIYGTFITAFDAFSRCITQSVLILRDDDDKVDHFAAAQKYYPVTLLLIVIEVILIKVFIGPSMGPLLRASAIFSFLSSPLIAYLNFRAITGNDMPETHKPNRMLILWNFAGLAYISIFAVIYVTHKTGIF